MDMSLGNRLADSSSGHWGTGRWQHAGAAVRRRRVGQLGVTDITYIKAHRGSLYLSTVIRVLNAYCWVPAQSRRAADLALQVLLLAVLPLRTRPPCQQEQA